ncbi:polyphosphate kinase [Lewinella marina]|uniref:Polyphosphate kinase n=1 Tax=Neolewinella marina TaxID=438751 RepID=A0A2G0CFJ1_9BACT|nr:polyphosphate kinase 1 [Neolewinella marina]NJB85568.1 polyphosphate kinase [Neolewinella marina]PHK98748.1 polyphosphate kinase 1 [Neolewinella marina]
MAKELVKRDSSWLDFNARVLQEAADPRVPLYERIRFLAIYSANLDEFYRVRVSSLRQFKKLPKTERKELFDFKPKSELKAIRRKVYQQQEEFGRIFRDEILPQLRDENIHLIHSDQMNAEQRFFAAHHFDKNIQPHLELHWLPTEGEEAGDRELPFLDDGQLCLAVSLNEPEAEETGEVALVPLPINKTGRFLLLPSPADDPEGYYVIFTDSVVRANLSRWMDRRVDFGYSFKLSRDAELYIDNEFDGDLLRKIEHSLTTRDLGLPTRFLYDGDMPSWMLTRLKKALNLSKYDMIPGARYHNFNDFFTFPQPPGREYLAYEPLPPLPHPKLEGAESLMDVIQATDILLSFPYQKYDYIPQLIREAADHPEVRKIRITLYRVAKNSQVVANLLYALKQGKQVEAFVEAKARFDEASNLYWGKEMTEAGAYVRYSYPAVKVHTKLLHIERRTEDDDTIHYSYIGTGNFNEKTARLYTDHALLTCRPGLGKDVERVFDLLRGKLILPRCKHLLVAPFNLETEFLNLIDREIAIAREGGHAYVFLKMNSLEEETMINKLREAARAGVEVRLIVRGICRLVPGKRENIQIISIIDRFLEHARIFIFGNNGQEKVYMGSADWMNRNLYRRVEVVTPIYDHLIKLELRRIMDMQWRDNQRARHISDRQMNQYRKAVAGNGTFRAQVDIYNYYKHQLEHV